MVPSRGRLRPLGLGEVEITGGAWAARQEVNAGATLAHCHGWMERLGWVANFTRAADGTIAGHHQGMMFADSDVFKLMEAMAWEVGRSGSTDADARFRQLTSAIAPAQEADGYLNTVFGRDGQRPRYSDLEWGHELYNDGHLLQAAVARARTTGADELVATARRVADHVCDTFGPGGIERVGGHPEVELGLAELARVTGEQRYLDQAALFIDRRGGARSGRSASVRRTSRTTCRSATPRRSAATPCVRCTSPPERWTSPWRRATTTLLATVIAQWEATIARRTYLTGGMGSHHTGEAFGEDFVLPPDRAYSETCAGIASMMLAWRLLLATGEPRFADLYERTLHNVVATSPAPDGCHFFYANPLHQRTPGVVPPEDEESRRAGTSLRAPWFLVACCPTNVARTLASLAAYLATTDDRGIQIHQYADCRIRTTIEGDRRVGVSVSTGYPIDGTVVVRVDETDGGPWALTLRVPEWATGAELVDADGRRPVSPGAVVVVRPFRPGDEVTLVLPMAPRWTRPDPRIDAVRGCVAVERGPLVMCAESVDLPGGRHVDGLRVDPSVPPRDDGGTVVVAGQLIAPVDRAWPYGADEDVSAEAGRRRRPARPLPHLGQPRPVDDAGVAPHNVTQSSTCRRSAARSRLVSPNAASMPDVVTQAPAHAARSGA